MKYITMYRCSIEGYYYNPYRPGFYVVDNFGNLVSTGASRNMWFWVYEDSK